MSLNDLIQKHIQQGILKTPRIIEAFQKIKREDFMPMEHKEMADVDAPFPIAQGQTISQPLTVAFMTELLDPRPGQKILDIGSGSGWQAAILAWIVGQDGKVYGLELISELAMLAKANIQKYDLKNIEIINGDGNKGLPDKAPFDRIMVAAAAKKIPSKLKKQLRIGGRMVIPVETYVVETQNFASLRGDQSIFLIERTGRNSWSQKEFPGFRFVPLVAT